MIRHLSACEERILESLAWQSQSPLWSHLKRIKLNAAALSTTTANQQSQLDTAFPLFEDVNIFSMGGNNNSSSVLLSSNQYPKITTTTTTNNNNNNNASSTTTPQINTADFLNTSSTSSFSSPIKQAPTITRVVCSADSSPLKINSILSQQQQSSSSSTLTNASSINMPAGSVVVATSQARLKHLTKYTACFFRKFYNLANTRLRTLIERLELAQCSVELFLNNQQQNNKDVNKLFF